MISIWCSFYELLSRCDTSFAIDVELGGDFSFGAVAWTRGLVGWIGEFRFCFQMCLDDLIG
jgi:hypothetical protein